MATHGLRRIERPDDLFHDRGSAGTHGVGLGDVGRDYLHRLQILPAMTYHTHHFRVLNFRDPFADPYHSSLKIAVGVARRTLQYSFPLKRFPGHPDIRDLVGIWGTPNSRTAMFMVWRIYCHKRRRWYFQVSYLMQVRKKWQRYTELRIVHLH